MGLVQVKIRSRHTHVTHTSHATNNYASGCKPAAVLAASTASPCPAQYLNPNDGSLTVVPSSTQPTFQLGVCYKALTSINMTVYYTWEDLGSDSDGVSTINKVGPGALMRHNSRET